MISLDSRSHARLLWIGALLAPAVAVQAVRLVASVELAPAGATTVQAAAPAPALARQSVELTPKQTKALGWLGEGVPKLATRSPMLMPPRPKAADQQPTPADLDRAPTTKAAPSEPVDDRPIHLKLSGMIGSDTKALAAISGKLRHVGDEVAPGWTIERIDSHHRVVTLKHTDGRHFEITPPTPSQERE